MLWIVLPERRGAYSQLQTLDMPGVSERQPAFSLGICALWCVGLRGPGCRAGLAIELQCAPTALSCHVAMRPRHFVAFRQCYSRDRLAWSIRTLVLTSPPPPRPPPLAHSHAFLAFCRFACRVSLARSMRRHRWSQRTLRSSLPLTFSSNFPLLSNAFSFPSSVLFLCFFPTRFPPFFLLSTLPAGVIIVAGRRLFLANLAGRAVEVEGVEGAASLCCVCARAWRLDS
jgi:hypothetical protein